MTETSEGTHRLSKQGESLLRFVGASVFYSAVIGLVVQDMWGLGTILKTTGWPFMFFLFVVIPYSMAGMMLVDAYWFVGDGE